eukprot:scaffold4279_cov70-Cylindrotheca_fusiformis.AAC.1
MESIVRLYPGFTKKIRQLLFQIESYESSLAVQFISKELPGTSTYTRYKREQSRAHCSGVTCWKTGSCG